MSHLIFINYRRKDAAGFALALQMTLESKFAIDDSFMDVSGSIEPGDDFLESINRGVGSSMIFLAVVGPYWMESIKKRQQDAIDHVVLETSALKQGKRVIPVLVDDAVMPGPEGLPREIQPLATRNAFRLRIDTFRSDCLRLAEVLKRQIADMGPIEEARRSSLARRITTSREPTVGKILADTTWISRDSDNEEYTFKFLQDGVLEYTSPRGTFDNGRWTQNGSLVVFDMNNHYSIYTAMLKNESAMEGSASNVTGKNWTFAAIRT